MKELLPYLALLVSVVACIIAGWTAVRAGRWRDSDAGKALIDRVDATESRLDVLETRMSDLPTKADMAEVQRDLHAVCKQIDNQVVPGLDRIEGYFLQLGMERTKS